MNETVESFIGKHEMQAHLRSIGLRRCATCKDVQKLENFGNSSSYYCAICMKKRNHEYFVKVRKPKIQMLQKCRPKKTKVEKKIVTPKVKTQPVKNKFVLSKTNINFVIDFN